MKVVFDWFLIFSIEETCMIHVFLKKLTMLLWLVFCSETMLAFEDLYGDLLWFSSMENQHIEVFWVMLSLDVSRCAGHIDQTDGDTTQIYVWDMGKQHVFEADASGGAGDLMFTMRFAQQETEVLMFDGLNCGRSRQQGL